MIKIRLREDIWRGTIDLAILDERNGKKYIAKPLVFEPYDGFTIGEPTASFDRDENIPEQLKQELRILGIFDDSNAATTTVLKAHLEDMRTLVFRPESESK